MPFACIVAADLNNGIGLNGNLPWPSIKDDFRFFKETTTHTISPNKQNAVIMGRKTWESLPDKFRPLPDRLNIIVSKTLRDLHPTRALQVNLFDSAVRLATSISNIENVYAIGGAGIYAHAFEHPLCSKIYLTRINKVFDADVFLPSFIDKFSFEREIKGGSQDGIDYKFEEWRRK